MTSLAAAEERREDTLDPIIQDAQRFWEGNEGAPARVQQMRDLFALRCQTLLEERVSQDLSIVSWNDPEEGLSAALNCHPVWALANASGQVRFLVRLKSEEAACGVAFSRFCQLLGLPAVTAVAQVAKTGELHSLVEHHPEKWIAFLPFLEDGGMVDLSVSGRRALAMHLALTHLTGSPFRPHIGYGWVDRETWDFVRAEAACANLGAQSLGWKLKHGWPIDNYPIQQDTHRNPQQLIDLLRAASEDEGSLLVWEDTLTLLARLALSPAEALELAVEQPEWDGAALAREHLGHLLRGACVTARLACALLGMLGEGARQAALEAEEDAEPDMDL